MRKSVVFCCCWGVVALLASEVFPQVTLGGTTVPRENIWVYMFIGQSNMAGRSNKKDTQTHPQAWSFNIRDNDHTLYAHHAWVPAKAPMHKDAYNNNRGGPGMHFLKAMIAKYPDRYFGIIQNANTGATAASTGGSNHYSKGGTLYNQTMDAAKQLKGKVTFGGVVCMLGIIERDHATASSFAKNIQLLVENMRTELGEPNLPLLIAQYEMGASGGFAATGTGAKIIISEITKVPSLLSNSAVIGTEWSKNKGSCSGDNAYNGLQYMTDDHHYNFCGHSKLMNDAIDILDQKGWGPKTTADTQAPTNPTNLAVKSVANNSIALSWSSAGDNVGVKEYRIFQGTSVLGTTSSTGFTVTALEACTKYAFTVKAADYAGNVSSEVSIACSTSCPVSDSQKPSVPAGLKVTSTGSSEIALSWTAATDNIGVVSYTVYLGDSAAQTVSGTTCTVRDLDPDTEYRFSVSAFDAAGNESLRSVILSAGTASSTNVALPFKVNIGGAAALGYAADQPWSSGATYGYISTANNAVAGTGEVSGTTDDEVFRAVRYKNFDYRIRVANGTYSVNLMFAEFWRTAAGTRTFSVSINGAPVTAGLIDIFKQAGQNAAYIVQSSVSVSSGVMEISLDGTVSDPILSAITIENASGVKAYEISSPLAGQRYKIGDTLSIAWKTNNLLASDAVIFVSFNAGLSYKILSIEGSIDPTHPQWEKYVWVIPAVWDDVSTISDKVKIKIETYEKTLPEISGTFAIVDPAQTRIRIIDQSTQNVALISNGKSVVLHTNSVLNALSVVSVNGQVIFQRPRIGPGADVLNLRGCAGLYFLRYRIGNVRYATRMVLP